MINNPMTRKRLARFKEMKRAYVSLWLLVALYAIGLFSELICNDVPLYVRFSGRSYFPVFIFYSEGEFVENGRKTRADYKAIQRSAAFTANAGNRMIFPPVPYGPYESVDPRSIEVSEDVALVFSRLPAVGSVNMAQDFTVVRSISFGQFIHMPDDHAKGAVLTEHFVFPDRLMAAISDRFANRRASRIQMKIKRKDGEWLLVQLSTFTPRQKAPITVRLTFREFDPESDTGHAQNGVYNFDKTGRRVDQSFKKDFEDIWPLLTEQQQHMLRQAVRQRFSGPVDAMVLSVRDKHYRVSVEKKDVRFPFPPTDGHFMGIDSAGRDVLARILYGLRTSMTFGFLLVVCSMVLGIVAGAVQGYFGGWADISGQRLIEIWSALPFLYVMILMGSIYGRSFSLLLFCYGLFNWIGISYYIRAEFLRLRKQPFVETAICMGISPIGIIFRHILPNALIPVITFFPFSLVGAIGSLAALDYLGFGLPPPTPSWGELLFQAQQYRWAWWLILYPSTVLFVVMLLGVFVGEGIRNAYDPKQFSRLE